MSRHLTRFEFSHFSRNLSLQSATFVGPIDFTMKRVVRRLDVSAARFREELSFYRVKVGVLTLEAGSFPFEQEGLNLRGFSFEGFLGNNTSAVAFARTQDPTEFSKDPYLQLEGYYSNTGDQAEAKAIHYRGRRGLRENAKNQRGVAEWSFWTKLGDFFLKYLTGYGARSFMGAGTAVFRADGAVVPRGTGLSQPLVAAPSDGGVRIGVHSAELRTKEVLRKPLEPFAYCLDLFVPLVNLRYDDGWEPVGQWRVAYALVHTMVGWLLVPLLVASLAGIVERR
jgi:hypothetical protein